MNNEVTLIQNQASIYYVGEDSSIKQSSTNVVTTAVYNVSPVIRDHCKECCPRRWCYQTYYNCFSLCNPHHVSLCNITLMISLPYGFNYQHSSLHVRGMNSVTIESTEHCLYVTIPYLPPNSYVPVSFMTHNYSSNCCCPQYTINYTYSFTGFNNICLTNSGVYTF